MTGEPLQRFAEAAANYCAWSEAPHKDEIEDARAALRHLSELHALALGLRELGSAPEVDVDRLSDAAWRSAYERFTRLPFVHYASIFDPVGEMGREPDVVTGDLADDLADIYRDLCAGLAMFRAGHVSSAEWEWAFTFRHHWGRHAASAIHALHCWFADEAAW